MRPRWRRAVSPPPWRREFLAAIQVLVDDLTAALLPAACVHCGRSLDGDAAARSRSRLVSGRLRRPLAGPLTLPLRLLCESCAACVRPSSRILPSEASGPLLSAFEPSPEFFALVHAFKYEGVTELADWFAARLARAGRRELCRGAAVLVPVPLHPERRRERGFNQSELLARHVGRRLGVPVHAHLLARARSTPPLARVPHAARRALVHDAFVRLEPNPSGAIRVVLVDDVVTTGATSAAARAALGLPPARTAVLCLCAARGRAAGAADAPGL